MVSNLQYGNFSIVGRVRLHSESLDCKNFLHFPIKNLTLLVLSTKIEVTYHRYDRKELKWQGIEIRKKQEGKY